MTMLPGLLPGVTARRVPTARLTVNVLSVEGRDDGEPVVLVHGNVSSAADWQEAMLALPPAYRPLALDLRGFGGTDAAPVDATRGLRDYADDVVATLGALGVDRAHLVGWSTGGGVVLHLLRERVSRVRTATLVNPVSPYGFGGTRLDGSLTDPSGAGSGAGAANPEFVDRIAAGDTSDDGPLAPRNVFLSAYVTRGFVPPRLEDHVASMLSTVVGDGNYPGDRVAADVWPNVRPGTRGILNAMAPTHFRVDDLDALDEKPPVLWIRGAGDVIVSDASLFDLANLGKLGVVPGWPGEEVAPPQPMLAQTRAVLDRYAAAGGVYREVVMDDAAHSPHIERPAAFAAALVEGMAAG